MHLSSFLKRGDNLYSRYHESSPTYEEKFVEVKSNPVNNFLAGISKKLTIENILLIVIAFILLMDTEDKDLILIIVALVVLGF